MLDILKSLPAYVVIPVAAALVSLVAFVVVKSFREGREISFWPPRIGARPEAAAQKERSFGQAPSPNPAVASPTPAQRPEGDGMPRFRQPQRESMKALKIIKRTEHSVIRSCAVDGATFVLKCTQASLCDLPALQHLAASAWQSGPLGTFPPTLADRFEGLAGAIPYMVWAEDNVVCELQEHVDGVPLGEIVLQNGRGVGGAMLLDVIRALSTLLGELKELRVVHRDLTPFNVLLTRSGEFRLIDWSFAAREGVPQMSFGTPGYIAPEYQAAQTPMPYTVRCDWYSFGATVFFLANGYSPFERGAKRFESGLKAISTGQWVPWQVEGWRAVVRGLLDPAPEKRDDPSHLGLQPTSGPVWGPLTDVLNVGSLGYVVASFNKWGILSSAAGGEAVFWRDRLQAAARGNAPISADARRALEWWDRQDA